METASPKIGIYAGSGTSHSWLWFVDLFETAGFYNLVFLNEGSIQEEDLHELDVLVISGGDTFAVAGHLGEKGARAIEAFVARGGMYIGSCAGAYLPMKSSQKPLDRFNFVDVKISNLSRLFPTADLQICSSCLAYGYDFIFHPVRESVALKTTPHLDPETSLEFTAPLYGGPGMDALDPSWVLAVYKGFTPKTLFLSDRKIADQSLVGRGAVVRVPFGQGCFYLLGPHLEHPGYKQANQFIIHAVLRETILADRSGALPFFPGNSPEPEAGLTSPKKVTGKEAKGLLLSVKRELSNSRITAGGLEFEPVQWLIGKKTYTPQKIRVYLESMWKRIRPLERKKYLVLTPGLYENILATASSITIELRRIKKQVDEKQDSLETAVLLFDELHILAMSFFDLYFDTLFDRQNSGREEDMARP
ncbi:BPL-N domain-containing protein [Desulfospira joergensenii]|uniref:BPL-N domain-containing protein n=1 Tax=Desulfospira joergensenii TaxID=53329 RepID=UPI0003B54EF8|nr:BPL-N domain-containing protein [Desulfospira joergensenii]